MKDIIKRLITEALADVDDDVDMIYELGFKDFVEYAKNTGKANFSLLKKHKINTDVLTTKKVIEANSVNPISIFINHLHNTPNHYDPFNKSIHLNFNNNAKELLEDFDGDIKKCIEYLDDTYQKTQFKEEFSEQKIKSTIYHELLHWIDDSLRGGHLKNTLSKAQNYPTIINNYGYVNKYLKKPINTTPIELEAQMGNIKQMKRSNMEIWDEMTFEDLINKTFTLSNVNNQLKRYPELREKWHKALKKRMNREGLLGKNMR